MSMIHGTIDAPVLTIVGRETADERNEALRRKL